MKILYIHQYFKTPKEPGGTRSYWIAKKLIEDGHQVVMLTTSPSIKKTKEEINIDGIDVIYIRVPYKQEMGIAQRLKSFLDFMIKSTNTARKLTDIDLVISTSTPLTVGFPALVIKKLRNIPYVFEVRDLWPEVPIQMGGLNNSILQKMAKWFEKTIYKNAKHIVALSPGMQRGVLSCGIPEEKTSMIPNMAKVDEFYPRVKNTDLLKSLNLKQDSFKVIHFGALGLANGAQTIIETAKLLKDDSTIEFVFLGGGSTELDLINLCKQYGLSNVHFLGNYPMETTSEIVNLCEVSLVSFLDLPILYTNSPNKLFDSLSAGKPIIVNSAGWTKDLVETYQCGYYVRPSVPADLMEKILYLKNSPAKLKTMGQNSRKLAEAKYDKSILCQEFSDLVRMVSGI